MDLYKQNYCDWVLNQSKRFPGKYYYFNVVTGESLWSFNGTESELSKNSNSTTQVEDEVRNCPEPVTPQNENTVTPSMFNPRNSSENAPTQTFSTAIFSKYINEAHFQNITRTPVPLFGRNTAARQVSLVNNTPMSEPDRDLFVLYGLTRVPLSQRFASIGNISSPSDYNYNYCKPVKEFHTSTPIRNLWNVTEQVFDNNKYEQEKISQLQYKRKLVEPKLILKEAKVKILLDKVLKDNEDTDKRSLSQPNKVDYSGNDKSNKDSLKRLDEGDLRFVLQSKRQKSVDICYEKQEREKKRVTFNLQNYDDDGYSVPNNEETLKKQNKTNKVSFKASIPIVLLKKLTKIPTNNEWYISVDENVLLEDFEFVMDYVATDKSCKLLIPHSIVMYIEELARGEHRGRSYVMQARHVHRRLGNFGNVQVVKTEDGASMVGDVIKCCMAKIDMGEHVALITKIKKLEDSAKSFGIQVYNLNYIKNGTKPSTEYVYDERNIGNNIFLQNEEDFDPFVLSKTVHTVNSSKNLAFHDSDSTLYDYDEDENTVDICQSIEKLNVNDKVLSNIKRVIKNCNAKTKISDRNIDNSNINTPIKSIFDPIHNKNESFNINNNSTVNLTKRVDYNLHKRENSNINVFTDKIRRDLRDDNLSKTNLTTTNISNDKHTNKGENIWKVQNEKHNFKKHEHLDTVEDKLRRFEVKDATIESNIVLRLEEWICCFVQIMEDLINLVLQKNVDTKNQIPFSLRDGLVDLKDLYTSTKEVKVIIEKLLALCRFCPMKGSLNEDIEPNDFLKILGCGFLLVDSLEGVLSEYLSDIKGLLETLLENIQTCHTHEDPVEVETPMPPSEIDEDVARTYFIKRRREIVEYLKRHFVEWSNYDEDVNEIAEDKDLNENVKIHRASGRNLSSFRIDNKKRITIENPKEHNLETIKKVTKRKSTNKHSEIRSDNNTLNDKDGHGDDKAIRNESSIVANKDKEKSNLDLDALDYSEIGETTTSKPEGFDETQSNFVNLTRCDKIDNNNDVRDSTADSGLENENHACTFIRHFLAEVSGTLITIHTFLLKCHTDLRDDKMTDETKKGLLDKATQLRTELGVIMQKLKAIIERQSRPDSALKYLLLKGGSDVAEDRRMTNYRQTVTKVLEQAQILESSLKLFLSLENDAGDSGSSTTEINHFNMFQ